MHLRFGTHRSTNTEDCSGRDDNLVFRFGGWIQYLKLNVTGLAVRIGLAEEDELTMLYFIAEVILLVTACTAHEYLGVRDNALRIVEVGYRDADSLRALTESEVCYLIVNCIDVGRCGTVVAMNVVL